MEEGTNYGEFSITDRPTDSGFLLNNFGTKNIKKNIL